MAEGGYEFDFEADDIYDDDDTDDIDDRLPMLGLLVITTLWRISLMPRGSLIFL